MLVLKRREGESLIIKTPDGQEIIVMLTQYRGELTNVGIEAPDDYVIIREELEKIQSCS